MRGKNIVTGFLLLFLATALAYFISQEADTPADAETAEAASTVENDITDGVVVYYFHNVRRCPTCIKIEKLAYRAVHEKFADELDSGRLMWKVVNVEDEGNKHFAERYHLIAQALVLVDYREETPGQWKNLERIWDLVWEEEQFLEYVDQEIKAFLGEG